MVPGEVRHPHLTGALVLGIECSGPRTAVALVRDRELLAETARDGTGHNEVLPGMLDELLERTGGSLDRLGAIGVTAGPGMFTALRVGLAFAAGLALPRRLPAKAVGTLPALAETCLPARRVLALVDARRGQVYCGLYDSGRALLEPRLADPGEVGALARQVTAGPVVLAGSGVEICRDRLAGIEAGDSGVRSPAAFAVACLARDGLERDGPDRPEDFFPRYLRRTDAEINRELKEAGPGGRGTVTRGR